MIVGMLRIPLTLSQHAEVLEVLRSVQGPVLALPGCKAYHIYEDQGQDPAVVLVERWESKATLEAHIRSEIYRRILGAIELAGGPPEVSFEVVTASEGMELVERLRKLGGTDKST
jgi:quinol monooxygenase YgiN